MAYIEEREGKFTVRWSWRGHKHRTKPLHSRKAAEKLRREIEDSVAAGRAWSTGSPEEIAGESLKALIDAWIADLRRLGRKTHTLELYEHQIGLFLRWTAADLRRAENQIGLNAISHDRVAGFQGWLVTPEARGGRGVSAYTAAAYAVNVVRLWEWAGRTDRFGDDVPRFRPPVIEVPPSGLRVYAPTWEQMDAGIAAAGQLPRVRWLQRQWIVQRCTGLRPGQVRRLRREDIDRERRLIDIRPELGKSRQEKRGRVIPYTPVLDPFFAAWGPWEGPLLPGAPRWQSPDTTAKAWGISGVPESVRVQPSHCFRRGFLAGLARAGVDREIREILVGHSGGVQRVYIPDDPFFAKLRAAVELVPPIG